MEQIDKERFSGFASLYDSARPEPPAKIVDIILGYLGKARARRVVDLGSGTGLSTAIWQGSADGIIGIEPTADMRKLAVEKYPAIHFYDRSSYSTGLEAGSTDVITCSQSFHWMEPVSTLDECSRILVTGGIFAVYDCNWSVSWDWRAEKAYEELYDRVNEITQSIPELARAEKKYPKGRHFENMAASKKFSYTRQIVFDNVEECDAARFINIALSQGQIQNLIKKAVLEIEKPVQRFIEICNTLTRKEMRVGYVMNIGVK